MELSIFQIILISVGAIIFWDLVRLLFLKVLSKKIRIFSIVPDTEQARLSFVSKELGVPVTEIINEKDVYMTVDNTDVEYKISCVPNYVLTKVGAESEEVLVDSNEASVEEVEQTDVEETK